MIARPPFDAELRDVLEALPMALPPVVTVDMIPMLRQAPPLGGTIADIIGNRPVTYRTVTIPGFRGDEIEVSVLRRTDHAGRGPGIYYVHAGGLMFGDRFLGLGQVIDWVEGFDAVCVTVEYRLAPEYPDPYPVEDSYAGLLWTSGNAAELGIDPDRLVVLGSSAGGGVAAGTVLLARDRRGPAVKGQMLLYPMLDDRDTTVSARQFDGAGLWTRGSNATSWTALLGDRRGTADVSIYAAPGRATDLSGLPPTFLACGSADLFRDEDIAYASGLWAAGGDAELHVWAGGYHTWDTIAPEAELTARLNEARTHWFVRVLRR